MAIAAIWGTTVGYSHYWKDVIIERNDGRVAVISQYLFDYMFSKLDNFTAALKEDCIEYVINQPDDVDLFEYPEWYIDACADGIIYEGDFGYWMFSCEEGEFTMYPNSVILRNYKGELKYLEGYNFHKYYDTLRE